MTIRRVTDIPRGTNLEADICVVGGGPAGITFALRLEETTNLNVVLIESGGLDINEAAQDLNTGTNEGLNYYDLAESRVRILGGASEKWAGWCRPLDPIDFTVRPWVPNSGWAVTFDDMLPYYGQAAHICQLEQQLWSPTPGLDLPPMYRAPFVGDDVEIALWQGSPPTKFGSVFRERLAKSDRIDLILDATATAISSDTTGSRATGVQVGSLAGNEMTITARAVVLAAGALETARLLLVSNQNRPGGLANEHDLVGRYFMEHPHLVTGRIELYPEGTRNRPRVPAIDSGRSGIRARLAMQRPSGAMKVAYTVSEERQVKDQLLNFSTHLQTVGPVDRDHSDAYQAFKLVVGNLRSPKRLWQQLRTGSLPAGTGRVVMRLLKGSPEVARVIVHEALLKPKYLGLYTQCEQAPNPDSRVTVDWARRDALGMPRLKLNWQLSRIDKESAIKSQQIIGEHLETAGLGRLVPESAFTDDSPDWGSGLRGGHHHLGTARMSPNPRTGVVDANGQAHGVTNLFIADSSIFPSGGYANPLLTLVAWSLRVADHVGKTYSRFSPRSEGDHDPEEPRTSPDATNDAS